MLCGFTMDDFCYQEIVYILNIQREKSHKSHKRYFEMFQDKMTFNVYIFWISIIRIMIKSTFLRCNMPKWYNKDMLNKPADPLNEE